MQKQFLESKLNWVGIISLIIAISQLQEVVAIIPEGAMKYVLAVVGALTIFLRTWQTNTTIAGSGVSTAPPKASG